MAPVRFQTLAEVAARESFDDKHILTIPIYAGVVGPTDFPDSEMGRCQLWRETRICNSEFQNGWVVSTKDGKEVLLGGCCAAKHFQLEQFRKDTAAATRQLELTELKTRLAAITSDEGFRPTLDALYERLSEIRLSMQDWKTDFPAKVVRQLEAMAKAGAGGVSIEVKYLDEDERGNPVTTWEARSEGDIDGLRVWNQSNMGPVFNLIREIKAAFYERPSAAKDSVRLLRKRVTKLDEAATLPDLVARLERALADFGAADNLGRACLLSSSDSDQRSVAALALRANGKPSTASASDVYVRAMHADIRQRYGNRDFRVP